MQSLPHPVSDLLSNFNDQIAHAAKLIGRSKVRQAIFEFVYRNKRQIKTIPEISKAIGKSQAHVLKEGGKMAGLVLEKIPGGYKKHKQFAPYYKKILALARNKEKLERFPTKISPKINANTLEVKITFPRSARNAIFITIDDLDSFSRARNQSLGARSVAISEMKTKRAFQEIIGERGSFKDWGGEKSDLYTTHIRLKGKRVSAAIAFKGKGTRGKLVPSKMGKNGDQINRLFEEPAQLFIVVYGGQIDSSVISQMMAFAIGKAMNGQKIYYGVIDGSDLVKVISAYSKYF